MTLQKLLWINEKITNVAKKTISKLSYILIYQELCFKTHLYRKKALDGQSFLQTAKGNLTFNRAPNWQIPLVWLQIIFSLNYC